MTAHEFVAMTARLTQDGESPLGADLADDAFEMSSEDAVETLHSLISTARNIASGKAQRVRATEATQTRLGGSGKRPTA